MMSLADMLHRGYGNLKEAMDAQKALIALQSQLAGSQNFSNQLGQYQQSQSQPPQTPAPPQRAPEIATRMLGKQHEVTIGGQAVCALDSAEEAQEVAERLAACAMEPMAQTKVTYVMRAVYDYANDGLMVTGCPVGYQPPSGWPDGIKPIERPDGWFFIPHDQFDKNCALMGYSAAMLARFIEEWVNHGPSYLMVKSVERFGYWSQPITREIVNLSGV